MAARKSPPRSELARYQAAVEHALDQLDWVVVYLYRIGKHELAAALKSNRDGIASRLE